MVITTSLKNKFLLVILLVALIFSGKFLVREKKTIIAKKTELAQLQQDLKLLDKILVDKSKFEEKIYLVRKTLPTTFEELSFFISQVEMINSFSGQKLEIKIDEAAKPEQNDLSSLSISLKATGSYFDLSQMLSSLAHLPYHTRIGSLKIEKTENNLSGLINFRLFLPQKGVK